jgi:hypothetical protein
MLSCEKVHTIGTNTYLIKGCFCSGLNRKMSAFTTENTMLHLYRREMKKLFHGHKTGKRGLLDHRERNERLHDELVENINSAELTIVQNATYN